MGLIETVEISHEDIFCWKFTICTEIVRFDVSFVRHF